MLFSVWAYCKSLQNTFPKVLPIHAFVVHHCVFGKTLPYACSLNLPSYLKKNKMMNDNSSLILLICTFLSVEYLPVRLDGFLFNVSSSFLSFQTACFSPIHSTLDLMLLNPFHQQKCSLHTQNPCLKSRVDMRYLNNYWNSQSNRAHLGKRRHTC